MSPRERTRQRIDTTAVRDQAVRGGNKGSHTLDLPEGIREWRPEKETEYEIRILPYTVTLAGHPDDREIGTLWYRRPFRVHFSVGGSDRAVVCPKSFGKPCPICQEVDALYKDGYEKNQKVINAIKATKFCAFAALVKGVDDIVLFVWNESKFAEKLEKELKKAKPENLAFADSDEGRMLVIRTEMEEPGTKEFKAYLTTDRIDFADAGDLTYIDDETLDEVPKIDEVFRQLTYDQIAKLFHGVEEEAEEEAEPAAPPPRKERRETPETEQPKPPRREEAETKPSRTAAPRKDEGEVCPACQGSGKNSRGRVCGACQGTGMKASIPSTPAEPPAPPAKAEKPPSRQAAPPAAAEPAEGKPSDDEW